MSDRRPKGLPPALLVFTLTRDEDAQFVGVFFRQLSVDSAKILVNLSAFFGCRVSKARGFVFDRLHSDTVFRGKVYLGKSKRHLNYRAQVLVPDVFRIPSAGFWIV